MTNKMDISKKSKDKFKIRTLHLISITISEQGMKVQSENNVLVLASE